MGLYLTYLAAALLAGLAFWLETEERPEPHGRTWKDVLSLAATFAAVTLLTAASLALIWSPANV